MRTGTRIGVWGATKLATDAGGWRQINRAGHPNPEVLSYEVGTPATYGFTVRNGRSLSDNAPEVTFSLVLNTATTSGLTHAVSERMRDSKFPYVVMA